MGTTPSGRASPVGTQTRASAIQAPRLPRVYVPRTRLWRQLDETSDASVRLLVAPVGAGKTLGVGGWVRSTDHAQETRWISGDRSWTPERLAEILDEAGARRSGPADSLGRTLVVVDDAHLLPPSTLRLIDQRLASAPDGLKLLLLARYDLPFTRLMPELLGHFAVIRGEVLRLDEAEAHALVTEHARTEQPEVLDAVTRHAQGWSAALVLTARAVAAASDPVATARRFDSGDASIAARLGSDVFAALQPRERHLLLSTATEERVSTDTAVHLSNDADAAEILAGLEFTGLLVSRLPAGWRPVAEAQADDDTTPWYRIHPLLVEVVRRRLRAGGVDVARAQSTVRRAVLLDIDAGHSASAFTRLLATQQVDEAANVLGRHGASMLIRGEGTGIAGFARHHSDTIDAHPDTWFVLALERWLNNDTTGAGHWLDRIIEATDDELPEDSDHAVRHACVRLMRARMGAEPTDPALSHARRVVVAHVRRAAPQPLLPLLFVELGVGDTWRGDLARAETSLTTAVTLCQTRGLTTLQAAAMSHLALTLHMLGQERASGEVAAAAQRLMTRDAAWKPVFIEARAGLAADLARLHDATAKRCFDAHDATTRRPVRGAASGSPESPWETVHSADPVAQFWHRIRLARQALTSGSVIDAERVLQLQPATGLSDHLRVVLLVEHAFLSYLADDEHALLPLEAELEALGAPGEAALLAGMRHELAGERKPAAAAYATAAEKATYPQPATRAFALAAHAQILDVLGEGDRALELLREATTATEVRRNAAPFLGWSRQGTPIQTLLGRLLEQAPTEWVKELADASAGNQDIVTVLAAVTAAPRERARASEHLVRPTLSAREREVLNELARGATYADIAAALFVSENTVKTHVSSLYGKLAVSRRSEALAVARNINLL